MNFREFMIDVEYALQISAPSEPVNWYAFSVSLFSASMYGQTIRTYSSHNTFFLSHLPPNLLVLALTPTYQLDQNG